MNGLIMKYFVLKPKGNDAYAKASRAALSKYADWIIEENSDLALDLKKWVIDLTTLNDESEELKKGD